MSDDPIQIVLMLGRSKINIEFLSSPLFQNVYLFREFQFRWRVG
jgi:hypothetical protein